MRALCAGKDLFRFAWRNSGGRQLAHLDALVSHELHAGAPVRSLALVAPEQWGGTHPEWTQQHTHLTRLRGPVAIPLTLFTQRARAATANACCMHYAQAAGLLAKDSVDE
jgi:hypothetical protein